MSVFRIYVEKKPEFAVEAEGMYHDIKTALSIEGLEGIRVLNRYDVQGVSKELFEQAVPTVFSEPQVDNCFYELPSFVEGEQVFAVEYLPGQFDQRADSCAQCIQILSQGAKPIVRTARVIVLSGTVTDEQLDKIKAYVINPVESKEAALDTFGTLEVHYDIPTTVATLTGFIGYDEAQLAEFIQTQGLAMDLDDIKFCQKYFKEDEQRDPTITEIKMIDTYWSDHCRHTTFSTNIEKVDIKPEFVKEAFEHYLNTREELYKGKNKPITLMDMAVIGAKKLKADGILTDTDESEEINACSVKIKVDVEGDEQDWLLMFKNETHNHPTEIEPFGGAATCLGGAIRDPLSGRSYVYQAMRVTGAADPTRPESEKLEHKLSQRKIVTTAAAGYSSYGNQIGLATGHVHELYHPGYVAKRMEIGAVLGAAPQENVIRERPQPGDLVVLLGGRTGRDGCGGATGSSKSHTVESLETCGAEVQKGNAPEERKLQRLFRNGEVTRLIKRCNDFGAGGVSVAIGELADGLHIDLNKVPKKYDGLDGTELAISESQERMAVVVAAKDAEKFIEYAHTENLEATVVAEVTEDPRLVLEWNGVNIVNLSREFLNSNGAAKYTDIVVEDVKPFEASVKGSSAAEKWENLVSSLNVCSQKGLVERFDSTIGANTVLMPFGGKYQLTPAQAMAAKIPVLGKETKTCSLMGWGFNPYVSSASPFHGAMLAVIESVAKVICASGSYHKCWLTFQEYFERTQNNPSRWGKPFAALLGALEAQLNLGIGSIGGKDSMSGTFEDIDVPPTLVSFAVSVSNTDKVLSPEFKEVGSKVVFLAPKFDENGLPDFDSVKAIFDEAEDLISSGKVKAAWAVTNGGIAEGVFKMALGNRIGVAFDTTVSDEKLYGPTSGAFLLELDEETPCSGSVIGHTVKNYTILINSEILDLAKLQKAWEDKLEPVFACNIETGKEPVKEISYRQEQHASAPVKIARPKVLIPVFPGTNCEYDTAKAFANAGADPEIVVIKNLSSADITESVEQMTKKIRESQIIMLPGGFSGGDEPDGSGKFITAFFRNPSIKESVTELLNARDGLMLGICNGFQALIKLGLVPYGEIREMDDTCPTLTFNTIGRHQSMLVHTRVASNKSPWMMYNQVGDVHTIPVSHGEGRFVASSEMLEQLELNGQIATQYCDLDGNPTMDIRFNPNTSLWAIEGITSPDGRVFGKMGHSERIGNNVYKNVEGDKDQQIFKAGVDYFRG